MTKVAIVRQVPRYEPSTVRDSVSRALGLAGIQVVSLASAGMTVLVKPNFIREGRPSADTQWEQLITHGAVIAAVVEELAEAMGGQGRIVIADAPQTDSDFDRIVDRAQVPALFASITARHPRLRLDLVDLRRELWVSNRGVVLDRMRLPDAPGGYTCVDLGEQSAFKGKAGPFYGADYDSKVTASHHSGGRHEYLLASMALDADLFVNLPKMKTHKKVGVTLSLKNLVGINGDKNYLPHFTMGTPGSRGDEFAATGFGAEVQSRATRWFKAAMNRAPGLARALGPAIRSTGTAVFGDTEAVVRSGNWHGNDTAWRMVLDLNRILFHYEGSGGRRRKPLRYLSIVDGIVAGEGNGPLESDALPCGVLVAGTSPVAVDQVCATLMGFDWKKIPMIREAYVPSRLPIVDHGPDEIEVLPELGVAFHFKPHFGWVGHIEA